MKRQITQIVIHCSDSPNGRKNTITDINAWHKEKKFFRQKEFSDKIRPTLKHIGYHHVIEWDGVVKDGRDYEEVGAHVFGHNKNSLGICMIGRDAFSIEQWNALAALILQLQVLFPDAEILGHRDLNPQRTCPGFDVKKWLGDKMYAIKGQVWEAAEGIGKI